MALTLTLVAGGKTRVQLADIDPDVVQAIEDAYAYNLKEPDTRLQADVSAWSETEGATPKESAEEWLHQARSYAYQRPAGRLTVTGNSTIKGLARFKVSAYIATTVDETSE